MKSLCLLLSLAATLLAAPVSSEPAPLSGGDYAFANSEWNGLSRFVALAGNEGYDLQISQKLDMGELGPKDRLIIVYPTSELDAAELTSFVIDGGKVLLADDFGASGEFLNRLGIERLPLGNIEHDRFFLGRPSLPIVTRGGKHPLLKGVSEVVANHPAALTTRGGPVLPYADPGYGLVYDMKLSRGKVVVIGDASLLINHMLPIADNRRFVANTLAYLCKGVKDCRPHLLVGDLAMTGSYKRSNLPDKSVSKWLSNSFETVNDVFDKLETISPPRKAIYYASLLLMGGVIVFLFTIFPVRRSDATHPEVAGPDGLGPLSEFEWNLRRYEQASYQANYALPVSILKTEFERLFFSSLAEGERIPPPGSAARGPFIREMARRYTDVTGESGVKPYKQVLRLLTTFAELPPRHQLFLDNDASFSERDLLRIHAQCVSILDQLGVREAYERRTHR